MPPEHAALTLHAPPDLSADLADGRLISGRELDLLLGIGRATRERLIASGKAPQPIRLGRTLHRWRLADVLAWVEAGCPRVPRRQ